MTIPYTYLIGWTQHNAWYYGVRYGNKCNPNDLWVSYFTSSDIVADMRIKHGEPDIIQIRKTFTDAYDAREWEHKVLRRLKVIYDDKWLNQTDNKAIILNEASKAKISAKSKGRKNPPHKQETKNKIGLANKGKTPWNKGLKNAQRPSFLGKTHSEETKQKIRNAKLGGTQTKESNKKRSDALKGRTFTPEHLEKLRQAAKARYAKPPV